MDIADSFAEKGSAGLQCDTVSFAGLDRQGYLQPIWDDSILSTSSQEGQVVIVMRQSLSTVSQLIRWPRNGFLRAINNSVEAHAMF